MSKNSIMVTAVLLILFLVSGPAAWAGAGAPKIMVNGQQVQFEADPVILGGTTMVPVRGVMEHLGLKVDYYASARAIHAQGKDLNIDLAIGGTTGQVNGLTVKLRKAPRLIKGRTMVPLRFFAESMGAVVNWDGHTRTISIIIPDGLTLPGQGGGNLAPLPAAKNIPFAWYQWVESPSGSGEWQFSSAPRQLAGDWYRAGHLQYMDFTVVTAKDQYLSQPPLQTFAPILPPQEDYSRYFVIWSYLGEANTGGYSIGVEKVEQSGKEVQVTVRLVSPAPGQMVTEALSYPTDTIRIVKKDMAQLGELNFTFVDQKGNLLKKATAQMQ